MTFPVGLVAIRLSQSVKPMWRYADRRLEYCALRTGTAAST